MESVDSSDSETVLATVASVISPDDLMLMGLRFFYTEKRISRCGRRSNITRFRKKFGPLPVVAVSIWEDLQTTSVNGAKVPQHMLWPEHFLMALNHLRKYPTEDDREGAFDMDPKAAREWVWYYCEKIRALKTEKIRWPEDWGTDIWIVTVDGTHCWINEPKHPEFSQDRQYYSHKFAKAGINYELAISIADSRLVWMNGPFKAGSNDGKIFRDGGLRDKLMQIGKKAIGDRGYVGYPNECCTYNAHDRRQVKKFKSRALKRHETFNFMTKRYKCLDGRFRNGPDRFATCFEAVCVICQYETEHNMPLFDVLIKDIM